MNFLQIIGMVALPLGFAAIVVWGSHRRGKRKDPKPLLGVGTPLPEEK